MIIQVHITNKDLERFFDAAGYITSYETVTDFITAYHNRLKEVERYELHVVTPAQKIPAKPFFEQIMKEQMLTPDARTISIIDKLIKDENNHSTAS